jgi:hypothetical protein
MKFSHRARAWLAYIRSFFKKNWQLCDYPIHYMPQTHTGPDTPERLRVLPWRADILGWYLAGTGNTREEVYADLESKFATARENRTFMPRPGRSVPIAFASAERISVYPDLRDHFINEVLAHEWAISLRRILSLGLSRRNGQHRVDPQDRRSVRSRRFAHRLGQYCGNLEEITNQIGQFPEDPILKAIRLDREARGCHVAGLPKQPWNTTSE